MDYILIIINYHTYIWQYNISPGFIKTNHVKASAKQYTIRKVEGFNTGFEFEDSLDLIYRGYEKYSNLDMVYIDFEFKDRLDTVYIY